MPTDELYEKGIAIREEMLGPAHGRAKVESQPDFTREFEELITRYCFASVWGREGLPRSVRSMITIAMLVALGRAEEIKVHVKGAISQRGEQGRNPRGADSLCDLLRRSCRRRRISHRLSCLG